MQKIDLEKLTTIIEIPLDPEPNYTFDTFINDKTFNIMFRTFVDEYQTRITISVDNIVIVDNAPINIYQYNLNYFSDYIQGSFFFLRNNAMTDEPTFLSLGNNNLRLFYGI